MRAFNKYFQAEVYLISLMDGDIADDEDSEDSEKLKENKDQFKLVRYESRRASKNFHFMFSMK